MKISTVARRIAPVVALATLLPVAAAAAGTPVAATSCIVPPVLAGEAATRPPESDVAPRGAEAERTPHPDPEARVDPRLDGMAAVAARLLQACWNAGDWEAVVALSTPRFLQTSLGIEGSEPRDRAAALAALDLGTLQIASLGPVTLWSDGRGAVEVRYRRGHGSPEQAVAARWFLVAGRGIARFDEEILLPPPPLGDRVTIGVGIASDEAPPLWDTPTTAPIVPSPVLALHGANRGSHPRTLHLQAAHDKILGVLTLPARTEADLVLLDLPPGTYSLVDATGSSAALRLVVGDGLSAISYQPEADS
jgi:hypothetical protein